LWNNVVESSDWILFEVRLNLAVSVLSLVRIILFSFQTTSGLNVLEASWEISTITTTVTSVAVNNLLRSKRNLVRFATFNHVNRFNAFCARECPA